MQRAGNVDEDLAGRYYHVGAVRLQVEARHALLHVHAAQPLQNLLQRGHRQPAVAAFRHPGEQGKLIELVDVSARTDYVHRLAALPPERLHVGGYALQLRVVDLLRAVEHPQRAYIV